MEWDPIFHDFRIRRIRTPSNGPRRAYCFPGSAERRCARKADKIPVLYRIPQTAGPQEGHEPNRFAAEFDWYLESLIGHPQMLRLARDILGENIRYDHCVSLNRPGGNRGTHWHTHGYGEEDPSLGFVRIFFYVNGFEPDDGGLKVVPGSHLFREKIGRIDSDEALQEQWISGKTHPVTGEPLQIHSLSMPPGTVIAMWTFAAHGVNPRQPGSDTRWCVVYAYRNPGLPSNARWISEEYEKRRVRGAEGLLSLY